MVVALFRSGKMDNYDYAKLAVLKEGFVRFWCSDSKQIDIILAKSKGLFPDIDLDSRQTHPGEEKYSVLIKGLSWRDEDVCWWIVKQLLLDAWEPLGSYNLEKPQKSTYEIFAFYQFKRKSNSATPTP